MHEDTLFDKNTLSDKLHERKESALKEAGSITENQVLNNSEEQIVDYIFSKSLVMPLEMYPDDKTMTYNNVTVNEPKDYYGTTYNVARKLLNITIKFPYRGSDFLWHCQPNSYSMCKVYGGIEKQWDGANAGYVVIELSIQTQEGSDNQKAIEKMIADRVELYHSFIKNQNIMIATYNKEIYDSIACYVKEQKKILLLNKSLVENLNIPLSRNKNAPEFLKVPMIRDTVPKLDNKPFHPEHEISNDDYLHILKIIRHEGRTHEQTSKTMIKFKEEEIRDLYLAHLNGHYPGIATGETFRKAGKTDIRLEFENRSAFVGECKIWHGEKQLHEAIDQLASYTTWRDCKCALIIYNKEKKGFTAIEKEMQNRLNTYENIVGKAETLEPGEWRIRIKSKEDEYRHIIIHVFLFNLYNPE